MAWWLDDLISMERGWKRMEWKWRGLFLIISLTSSILLS